MYLSKAKKQDIALLVNSTIYNRTVWFECIDKEEYDKAERYKLDYARCVVQLADDYGIELVNLERCREWLEEEECNV